MILPHLQRCEEDLSSDCRSATGPEMVMTSVSNIAPKGPSKVTGTNGYKKTYLGQKNGDAAH